MDTKKFAIAIAYARHISHNGALTVGTAMMVRAIKSLAADYPDEWAGYEVSVRNFSNGAHG